jgi:hypothetical protein
VLGLDPAAGTRRLLTGNPLTTEGDAGATVQMRRSGWSGRSVLGGMLLFAHCDSAPDRRAALCWRSRG